MHTCGTCKYCKYSACALLSTSPSKLEIKDGLTEEEMNQTVAYTADADGYQSELLVEDSFGCNLWKEKK